MKVRLTLGYLLLIFTIAHSSGDDAQTKTGPKASKNNVELEISTDAGAKSNGASTEATIKLTNNSKQEISLEKINGASELGIEIFDSADKPVKKTGLGEVVFFDRVNKIGSSFIPPGQSKEWKVDIGQLFQLVPGKYTVSSSILICSLAFKPNQYFKISVKMNFEIK